MCDIDKSKEELLQELNELKNEHETLKNDYWKDISELKKKEIELKESHDKYFRLFTHMRLMSDVMPDMLWAKDLNKKFTFVNKSVCKNLLNADDTSEPIGKTQSYFTNREIELHSDNAEWHTIGEICENSDEIILKEKKEMQFEEKGYVCGRYIFLDVHKAPLFDTQGTLVGIVGFARDITESKNNEISLKATVSALEASLESTADGILIVNTEGKITNWNKKFLEMWKLSDDILRNNSDSFVLNHILSLLSNPEKFLNKVNYLYSHPDESSFDQIDFLDGQIYERYSQAQVIDDIIVGRVWSFRDVTESRLAEDNINKLAIELQATLDTITAGICHIKDHRILWANSAHDNLFGYEDGSTIGMNTSAFFPDSEIYQLFLQNASIQLHTGKYYNSDMEMCKKDGTKLWCSLTGKFVNAVQPEEGAIWMIEDITYRKEAETILRESEKKHRQIIDLAPDAFLHFDSEGNIIEVNIAAMEISGYNQQEFLNMNIKDLFSMSVLEKKPLRYDLLNQGLTYKSERQTTRKDGSTIEIEMVSKKMPDGTIQTFCRDITARKIAIQKLKWNQSLLQLMSDSSPLGFFVVDNRTDEILYFNQRFCKIWNIEHLSEQMRKHELKYNDIIPYCLPLVENLTEFIESCKPLQDENNYIVVDDEIAFTEKRTIRRFSTQIRSDQNEYYGRFYIFEDISERKRAEEQLNRLYDELITSNHLIETNLYQKSMLLEELTESEAKLKEIIAIKDKFFSIVAHDLRGPFSGFLGLTDLMSNEAEQLTPAEIKRMAGAINKSANAVYMLIEDLLIWSASQTGSIPFIPEVLDLYEICVSTIYSVKHLAILKNIEFINNIEPVTHVKGDRNMLRTIFRNLVSNAIKFSNIGGKIEIGINEIKASDVAETSNSSYCIMIKDNGVGISELNLNRLFKIGEHCTTPGTNNEKGTGLGLLLCKEFVERHSGKIWVESEEGKGSTFYFSLPK